MFKNWHHNLNESVGASHPTIWKLIDDLKDEMVIAEQKVARFEKTQTPSRRNKNSEKRDLNYQDIIEDYGKIDNFDYLQLIAKNI